MPHDAAGNLLQAGDRVMIPAIVKDVSPQADYCNCTVETERAMPPDGGKSQLTLNTNQVVKVRDEIPAANEPAKPATIDVFPGNVVLDRISRRKHVVINPEALPGDQFEKVADAPHEGDDFSYRCGDPKCKCNE